MPTVPYRGPPLVSFAGNRGKLPYSQGMRNRPDANPDSDPDNPFGNEAPAERALIQRIRRQVGSKAFAGLSLGIGDDCALLMPRPGEQIAVTTDLSLAGRHFLLEWHPPEVVGHRTLARGLSDLAAMGARPLGAFVSLGLPRELTLITEPKKARIKMAQTPKSWIDRFFDGILALAEAHKTPLAGGDLAESQIAVADIVLIGAVPRGRALLRSGARAGDNLYITGALGGAAAGLAQLGKLAAESKRRTAPPSVPENLSDLLAPHFYPQPRIAQGLWLQRRGLASAAIDLSDGLSTDLAHICEESGVAAELDASALPKHRSATIEQALHGGEDYELLFTAPATARMPRAIAGVAVTRIGKILPRRARRPPVAIRFEDRVEALEPKGWEHFQ
jgi:thiamine-monophosphate kinase